MANEITFENHIPDVLSALAEQKNLALEMCGMAAEGYAKLLCPVDMGTLRNSITHQVADDECYIGTNMHYAPYVEFGTGVYYDGGRKTPWTYKDRDGWHRTNGQKAQPYLRPAVADHVSEYQNIIEKTLKGN